jgi:hypothetical protein
LSSERHLLGEYVAYCDCEDDFFDSDESLLIALFVPLIFELNKGILKEGEEREEVTIETNVYNVMR